MSLYKTSKHVKSSWLAKIGPARTEKPWGYEVVWHGFDDIHGKILHISAQHRTSLKYHKLKNESLFLLSGEAEVTLGDELSLKDPVGHPFRVEKMLPGDTLLVQSACPYRIKAVKDCQIIEIGNKRNDIPVRIEDDYGREQNENNS